MNCTAFLRPFSLVRLTIPACGALLASAPLGVGAAAQPEYAAAMPRAFGVLQRFEPAGASLTVKMEHDAQIVTLPLRPDTELRYRGSFGAPEAFFPGQHLMMLVLIDENRNWIAPRSISDDIHHEASHAHFAAVTRIDRAAGTYTTSRVEGKRRDKLGQTIERTFPWAAGVEVRKGDAPAGIAALRVGDEIIEQLAERDGRLVAVVIADRKGKGALREAQEKVHRERQDREGLPTHVNDVDPVKGQRGITLPKNAPDRAKALRVGDTVVLTAPEAGVFAGRIRATETSDSRQRLLLFTSGFVTARLNLGQPLRLWSPGTGPALLDGKRGVPESTKEE